MGCCSPECCLGADTTFYRAPWRTCSSVESMPQKSRDLHSDFITFLTADSGDPEILCLYWLCVDHCCTFPRKKGARRNCWMDLERLSLPIRAKRNPRTCSGPDIKSELNIRNNAHCTHPSKCLGTTKQGKFVTALSTFDDGANRTLS
jgi:hypothetical protein